VKDAGVVDPHDAGADDSGLVHGGRIARPRIKKC
jgi:hypothetical protein